MPPHPTESDMLLLYDTAVLASSEQANALIPNGNESCSSLHRPVTGIELPFHIEPLHEGLTIDVPRRFILSPQ